jgi:hypothetical protein
MSLITRLRKLWGQTDLVAIGAMLLSIMSLLVAIRSCAISDDALNETRLQYRQDRQLVLTGSFKEAGPLHCEDWSVKPIAEGFQYQQGRAFLPTLIDNAPVKIESSGWVHFLHSACASISRFSEERMTPKEPGFVSVGEGDIPLILESSYAVKGEAYTDSSLYLLHGITAVPHSGEGPTTVTFTGLSFVRRLPVDTEANIASLDKLFNNDSLREYTKPRHFHKSKEDPKS